MADRGTGQDTAQDHGTSNHLVTGVVDGDTFKVASGEEVRVLGIDSCEGSTPGGELATADARTLLAAENVALRAEPGVDRDPFGRLLRYVQLPGGGDFGEAMVSSTHTEVYKGQNDASATYVARLVERDGTARDCDGPDPTRPPTTAAAPGPNANLQQPVTESGSSGSGCEPGYSPCVPAYPPDLDCDDLSGPYDVTGSDPHGLDGNGDGEGCE